MKFLPSGTILLVLISIMFLLFYYKYTRIQRADSKHRVWIPKSGHEKADPIGYEEHKEHSHHIEDDMVPRNNSALHEGHEGVWVNSTTNPSDQSCLEWVKRAPKPPYFLTAVLLMRIYVKDRAKLTTKELKMWLQYLRYAGVEHVYVYDAWVHENESQSENLKLFKDDGYITYIDWHTHNPYTVMKTQVPAYQNCIDNYKDETEWQTAIDMDEYPFSPNDTNPGFMNRIVKHFSQIHPEVSEFSMQNYLFLGKPLEKELMIERLMRRTHKPANPMVKPIYIPKNLRAASVHHNILLKGRSKNFPVGDLRMNHYWGARLKKWDQNKILKKTRPDDGIQPIINAFKQCEKYVRPYL